MYLVHFIQKHLLKNYSIEQIPSILGISSYVWRLLQTVSEASWDYFKISPQLDTPTLVEAIRAIYGPNPVPMLFPNVKMVVDVLEAEEVIFTLVINKKHKRKSKASPLSFVLFSDFRSKTLLILRASSFPKTVISHLVLKPIKSCPSSAVISSPAIMTSKII